MCGRGARLLRDALTLVALQFASVRMIGQVPFSGVAPVELGEADEEPAVSVDTQLIEENAAPEVYIAPRRAAGRSTRAVHDRAAPREPRGPRACIASGTGSSPAPAHVGPSARELAAATLRRRARGGAARRAARARQPPLWRRRPRPALGARSLGSTIQHEQAEGRRDARGRSLRPCRAPHARSRRLEGGAGAPTRSCRPPREGARRREEGAHAGRGRPRACRRKSPELAQARERRAARQYLAAEEAVGVLQQGRSREGHPPARGAAAVARQLELRAADRRDVEPAAVEIRGARGAGRARRTSRGARGVARRGSRALGRARGGSAGAWSGLLRERAQAIGALEHELLRREYGPRARRGARRERRPIPVRLRRDSSGRERRFPRRSTPCAPIWITRGNSERRATNEARRPGAGGRAARRGAADALVADRWSRRADRARRKRVPPQSSSDRCRRPEHAAPSLLPGRAQRSPSGAAQEQTRPAWPSNRARRARSRPLTLARRFSSSSSPAS